MVVKSYMWLFITYNRAEMVKKTRAKKQKRQNMSEIFEDRLVYRSRIFNLFLVRLNYFPLKIIFNVYLSRHQSEAKETVYSIELKKASVAASITQYNTYG